MTEPAKADPDDLLYRTVEELEAAEASKPVDIDALGESLIKELQKRVKDPAAAKDIPGTTLMKLAAYFIEKNEREARERDSRSEDRFLSAVEVIDHPGLSVERREELIREQLQRVEVDRELLEAKLEELTAP